MENLQMKNAILDDVTITGGHNPFHTYNDPYGQLTIGGISTGRAVLGSPDRQSGRTRACDQSCTLSEGYVQGEMLIAEETIQQLSVIQVSHDSDDFKKTIKEKLVRHLAEQMIKNKLVEFTKIENIHTGDVTFKARAFLAPDNKVREIRINQK